MQNQQTTNAELLIFKNRIRGAKNPNWIISNTKNLVSPSAYSAAIKWLQSQPMYRKDVFSPGYPASPREIKSYPLLNPTSVQNELRWAAAFLTGHSTKLTSFVDRSLAFQRAFLLDDYSCCQKILGEIRTQFGESLWLIENEIAFLQIAHGTDDQIAYTKKLREYLDDRGIIDYLVQVLSARNETSNNPLRITEFFSKRIGSIALPNDLVAFMRFHMGLISLTPMEDIGAILHWESASSVVDYYEALLVLIQTIISVGYKTLFRSATSSLRMLQGKVSDPRLDMLLFELDGKDYLPHPAEPLLIDATNTFLSGDFVQASEEAVEALSIYPEIHGFREIAARSFAIRSQTPQHSDGPLSTRLIKQMSVIVSRRELDDSDTLFKVAFNFQCHAWAKSFLSFMAEEASSNPLETGNGLVHFAMSGAPLFSPLQLASLPELEVSHLLASRINNLYGECQASAFISRIAGLIANDETFSSIIWEEQVLLDAKLAVCHSNLEAALQKSVHLSQSSSSYYRQNAARIQSYALLYLQRTNECVRFISTAYVNQKHSELILPIREAVEGLDKEARQGLKGDISLVIALDLYCRFISSSLTSERNDACEDFLLANGISRPSEIEAIVKVLDVGKVVYYLRHICIESVMDSAIIFAGSKDLRDERVAVCRLLIDMDSANTELYQSEIKDIVRRSMIKQRTREVEQSKIYVDVDSLRKAVDKNTRESFGRYVSLVRQGVAADTILVIDKFREKTELGDIQQLLKLILPQNEVGNILRSVVFQLRDSFVSSTEYGLDGYLSSRIRHGTLQGQLRSPLEAAHLITNFDSTTGLYKPNEYWLGLVSCRDDAIRSLVSRRLGEFSENFDDFVREIKEEWIQIKKSSENTGLFNFVLTEPIISLIGSEITNETTFEQFLDCVLDIFQHLLEENLGNIRHTLNTQAKNHFNALMTSLQADLEALDGLNNSRDLINAITAVRTELQITLDRIIEWFRLSNSIEKEPFQIEEAINVAVESVRTPSNNLNFSLNVPVDRDVIFEGRLLVVLVDILFIIFENIVRHSGIIDKPFAFINMSFTQETMELRIENEVAPAVLNQETLSKLESITKAMYDEQRRDAVATEGGTGFLKIRKFLKFDVGVKPVLDFGFTDNGRFYVQFSLPWHELK